MLLRAIPANCRPQSTGSPKFRVGDVDDINYGWAARCRYRSGIQTPGKAIGRPFKAHHRSRAVLVSILGGGLLVYDSEVRKFRTRYGRPDRAGNPEVQFDIYFPRPISILQFVRDGAMPSPETLKIVYGRERNMVAKASSCNSRTVRLFEFFRRESGRVTHNLG